ncbi:B12-binding domain-containing radical SAM protein [Chloroflexota bacterium]
MKILLIRPAYSPLYQLITSKTKDKAVSPLLGLLYVAAALETDRHQVAIIDGEADDLTPSELVKQVEIRKPDIVGVGATTVDFDDANLVLEEVKVRFSIKTLLGGPHATVLADQAMHENPHIDYVVRGEGEITTRELLRQLEQKGDLSQVEGLSYREEARIIHNADRSFIPDLNENCLPARHLVNQAKYLLPVPGKGMRRITAVQAMRGCPFKCVYCYRMFGNRVRFRDSALVIDEIENCISNYGVEYVSFVDDTFMVNAKRVTEFCKEIINRNLKFSWRCYTRADTIEEDLLRIMKEAGCKQISIGVESGNQEILDRAGKATKLEQYVRAYELLEKIGFEKRGSFILGLPYEDANTLRDTIDFAKKLKLDRAFFNIATPYPGTQLLEMAERGEGLYLTTKSWKEFKRWGNAVIGLEDTSRDQLMEWQQIAMMEFYARPKIIFHHIKAFIGGDHKYFYYRPLLFGLTEFYHRKIKSFIGKSRI